MAEERSAAAEPVKVGDIVKGTVEHITAYGAFVRLATGQKAMIHISELSQSFVKKVEDILAVGQEVQAQVIKIDEKNRIDLSIKVLQARENRPPRKKEDDFEKKLSLFLKSSEEKIADLNNKLKDPRGSKKRSGSGASGGKR
ncbi:MAG: S1 RNA-binding domain-containing protein [Synergistaceae bacterium]|jgi:S1 RNA binding domain protein|nr:S1 RNA-binding domain-containing protein [Synergistaceae bacterium]